MTEDERRALGRTRRLVFQNIANGVPVEQIRESLRLSALEVEQAQAFVARKITENRTLRRQPTIPCGTLAEIRYNRRALLGVLSLIGDLDLSTTIHLLRGSDGTEQSVSFSKLMVQQIDHPEILEGASHRLEEAYK